MKLDDARVVVVSGAGEDEINGVFVSGSHQYQVSFQRFTRSSQSQKSLHLGYSQALSINRSPAIDKPILNVT